MKQWRVSAAKGPGLTRQDMVRQHPWLDGCDPDSRFPSLCPMGDGGEEVECRLNCEANPPDVLARFEKLIGIWPVLRMDARGADEKTNQQAPQDIRPAASLAQRQQWTSCFSRCAAVVDPQGPPWCTNTTTGEQSAEPGFEHRSQFRYPMLPVQLAVPFALRPYWRGGELTLSAALIETS